MAPRIQSRSVSNTLLPYLTSTSSSSSASSLPSISSISSQCFSRQFSATAAPQTKLRRQMFEWLNTEGAGLKHHVPGETNYLTRLKQRPGFDGPDSKRPFPNNQNFVSEPVLSEELRNEVYSRVVTKGQSLRVVSVDLGIDMQRIAAVVRLVELEKRQRKQVREHFPPFCPLSFRFFRTSLQSSTHMMSHKNRLVLKTPTWLYPLFELNCVTFTFWIIFFLPVV
jgi:hypothetical protein